MPISWPTLGGLIADVAGAALLTRAAFETTRSHVEVTASRKAMDAAEAVLAADLQRGADRADALLGLALLILGFGLQAVGAIPGEWSSLGAALSVGAAVGSIALAMTARPWLRHRLWRRVVVERVTRAWPGSDPKRDLPGQHYALELVANAYGMLVRSGTIPRAHRQPQEMLAMVAYELRFPAPLTDKLASSLAEWLRFETEQGFA